MPCDFPNVINTNHSLRLVRQLDSTGCGIACVSMITDQPYERVKSSLLSQTGRTSKTRTFYTRAKHLKDLLIHFGMDAEVKRAKGWGDITGVAIVGVDRKPEGYFHWIVVLRDDKRFLLIDPKTAEVMSGCRWADKKQRYKHSVRASFYVNIKLSISSIRI